MLTLIMLLALGSSLQDPAAQKRACGSEIKSIEINKATLHYFECGEGEPLVFVHGGLGDLHTFSKQLQTFAARFRVIAYSRRFSPPNTPPRPQEVNPQSAHVADLGALVKQLKATPAHLVAQSYGAYIALALALDHPELVRSLVLAEPPVLPLLSRTSVGESLRQSWIRRVNEPHGRHSRAEISRALNCEDLGKLKRPTLLVTGERSPAMFLLITVELERCLEGESHVMVPEAGHGMHSENAAFYNQAVAAFLQRH